MKRKMKTAFFILSALVVTLFSSCSQLDNDGVVNNETQSGLKILLTDAPFPYGSVAEANIVIDGVSIRKEDDASTDDDESGWIELTPAITDPINLLDLQNGNVATLVEDTVIENGTYSEIRLHIASAEIVYTSEAGGGTEPMKIPSGTSSGLKIKIDGNLDVHGMNPTALILDFDVSRSFLVQGNPDNTGRYEGFKFKPVIRATAEDISGWVFGNVTFDDYDNANIPDVESLVVAVLDENGDTISSAKPDMTGYYAVIGLLPGNYVVACSAEGYDDVQLDAIVNAQEGTQVDIELTETLATVTGKVVISDGTTPLDGVSVNISGATTAFTATTGEDGTFEIGSIPPDSYTVTLAKDGYDGQTLPSFDLILGEVKDLGVITMSATAASTTTATGAN